MVLFGFLFTSIFSVLSSCFDFQFSPGKLHSCKFLSNRILVLLQLTILSANVIVNEDSVKSHLLVYCFILREHKKSFLFINSYLHFLRKYTNISLLNHFLCFYKSTAEEHNKAFVFNVFLHQYYKIKTANFDFLHHIEHVL